LVEGGETIKVDVASAEVSALSQSESREISESDSAPSEAH